MPWKSEKGLSVAQEAETTGRWRGEGLCVSKAGGRDGGNLPERGGLGGQRRNQETPELCPRALLPAAQAGW